MWGTIISGGLSLIGGESNKRADHQAQVDQARVQAEMEALQKQMNWDNAMEEIRRMDLEHGQIQDQTKVNVGAMGFASDSKSQVDYQSEISTEFNAQRAQAMKMAEAGDDLSQLKLDEYNKQANSEAPAGLVENIFDMFVEDHTNPLGSIESKAKKLKGEQALGDSNRSVGKKSNETTVKGWATT